MLFEPTPIRTSRRGRWRGVVSIALPIALLAGVVGVGIVGSKDPTTDRSVDAVADASVDPIADAPIDSPAPIMIGATAIRFPTRTFDLATRTVSATIDAIQHGRLLMGDLVAIRGWLTAQTDGRGCAPSVGPPRLTDDLCWSSGVLRDDATATFRWADGTAYATGAPGIQLDPWIPPAVSRWGIDDRKGAPVGDRSVDGPIEPEPVVIIGAFHWPRTGDCTTGPHCAPGLVVERIVWVDGVWHTRPVVQALDPVRSGLDATESRQVVLDAHPGPTIVLSQALVPATLLGRLDPDAVLATPSTVGDDRLWYLRVMLPSSDELAPERAVRWIAIDDATGAILADQPAG